MTDEPQLPDQTPSDDEATRPESIEATVSREGPPWGLMFFVLLSVLIAVFAVQNIQDVELRFLGWSGQFPLILIIVGVFAVAIILDEVLGAVRRRRRRIRQAEKRELAGYRKQG